MSNVSSLILQRDGRLLASADGTTIPDLRTYLTTSPVETTPAFTSYSTILEDARHHLWRVPNLASRVLREWDGKAWRSHALPATYSLQNYFYLSYDSRGRLWLMPDEKDGQVALFQPSSSTWRVYPSYPLAVQNQLHLLGARELARLKMGSTKYHTLRDARPNRFAFRSAGERLFHFDGKKWSHWTLLQITGNKKVDEDDWEQTPYFNTEGILCVNISDKTWQWVPTKGWKARDRQPHPVAEVPTPTPPPNCGVSNPESIIRDSSGAIWMTQKRQLWKAAWGLCEPQLVPGQRHPVRQGYGMERVSIDPSGKALLSLGTQWHGFAAWAPQPQQMPETHVHVTRRGEDGFVLRFTATPTRKEKQWFRWRLDGKTWSALQTESSLPLEFVPAGKHRFEVAAIDARLQLDSTPATTTLEVATTPAKQLAKFMAMLRSSDYAKREAAVRAFSKQPARALPMLQGARSGATGEVLWWINAAIQEIENQSQPTK